MKRVLFFGIFDPEYARTRILTEGFTKLGYEIVLCRVDPRVTRGLQKYLALWRQGRALSREPFEQVFVLFPGHTIVWLARFLFGNRIAFDAFVSLYDSNVHDRKRYGAYALRAIRDCMLDWSSCALAQTVLVDTEAHRQYFIKHVGVPEKKLVVVPVGASHEWFAAGKEPAQAHNSPLKVGFYGSYIPLHGVETIVRAAALLRDQPFRFELIGSGQEYAHVQSLVAELGGLPNVTFTPRIPREKLIKKMRAADICLGIFGSTEKAARVVPNKVYECAALGKPIITADTPGVREIFTAQKDIFLSASADADALAKCIRTLASDTTLCTRLGTAARARMQERYTPDRIVRELLASL